MAIGKEEYARRRAEQDALIRSVFGTPEGKRLLRLMADEYVYTPIKSNDEPVVYRRLGQQDLVLIFLNTIWKAGEIHDRPTD